MVVNHLKAILFDLDGTLINTRDIDILAFEKVMWNHFGIKANEEMFRHYRGTPMPKIVASIAPPEKVDELVDAWVGYKAEFANQMSIYPGMLALLDHLKQAGLKLAVVTSQTDQECALTRQTLEFDGVFDAWITSDHVRAAKPDPEPINKALQQIQVQASEAVMIGDTFNDLEAGRRAGTYIGAVMWGFGGREKLLSYNPDYVFNTVDEIYTLAQKQ